MELVIFLGVVGIICLIGLIYTYTPSGKKWLHEKIIQIKEFKQ